MNNTLSQRAEFIALYDAGGGYIAEPVELTDDNRYMRDSRYLPGFTVEAGSKRDEIGSLLMGVFHRETLLAVLDAPTRPAPDAPSHP
ncbi:hypothetical protein [Streptomyces sp. NBC_00035]|uniref:hypothetical protein n=1 Tax=Streptomyces sp. NBC_00035 TaxID=2903614 RepID=UPI0032490AF3